MQRRNNIVAGKAKTISVLASINGTRQGRVEALPVRHSTIDTSLSLSLSPPLETTEPAVHTCLVMQVPVPMPMQVQVRMCKVRLTSEDGPTCLQRAQPCHGLATALTGQRRVVNVARRHICWQKELRSSLSSF